MVRTKQTTAKRLKTPNGTPKPEPKDTPTVTKSPPQAPELTEENRAQLKTWLDNSAPGTPFTVATNPISKKRKRASGAMQTQDDLYEERLSIQYEVRPREKWETLRRYKKFTVGNESIGIGQCILVKHDDAEDQKIEISDQWKARVCEVRALDTEHVFIRVAWLNRPEDLDTGRKPYHGKNELIPTNQMDIIDAFSVNGSVDVIHWDEQDDDSELMTEDQYFWRQTYDVSNTKTFSRLRTICIDNAPQNPDEMILQCGNAECRKWQHVKCIAELAVQTAAEEATGSKKPPPKKARLKSIGISKDSSALAKAETDSFTAEVFIKGMPPGANQTQSERSEIILTTKGQAETRTQNVCCLFCSKEIE